MRRTPTTLRAWTVGLALTLVGLVAPAPAVAQTPVLPAIPLTIWSAPPGSVLDGIGSWLATGNDPTAGIGQAQADYAYFHEFYFANSQSFGDISMLTFGGEKFVELRVFDEEEGRLHRVRVQFPWQAGRFYFPFVYRLASGVW
ncbi:MAG: hypothetical protein LC733_13735, partial [Actinobacteria bacterium]|nr:hypothetical protein [Actinomycetota bacterium]